jgi:hypothetical protein
MIVYWPWGLMIASLVTVTIWMNGHHWRPGWLVGAAAQLAQIGFGAVTGIWTFWFSALPMLMFGWNWVRHPARAAARDRELTRLRDEVTRLRAELAVSRGRETVTLDTAHGDQMIMVSRGVLDRLVETRWVSRYAGSPWLPSPITPTPKPPSPGPDPERGSPTATEQFGAYSEIIAKMYGDLGDDRG